MVTMNQFPDKIQQGLDFEQSFVEYAKLNGYNVTKSSAYSDINMHYDFTIQSGALIYRVDAKSCKRQDGGIWVEFRNVHGKLGWLYGHADLIAFDTPDHIVLISRVRLIQRCNALIDFNQIASTPNEYYKVYSRQGRNDKLGLIRLSDIAHHLWDFWIK